MIRLVVPYFLLFSVLLSQIDYLEWHNHTELEWGTIETEHFLIHFHEGTEKTAREAATIAEYIYPNVTELYNYYPDDKTVLIVTDYDDYSNGVAYYNFNKMIISARPADFYLRGSHRWLQNVITHEFTHIVQVGASLKYTRFIPYSALQVISYAKEKREDVVYGFPNNIVNYPISSEIVPPWFAEGTAQAMYDKAFYDYWDSTRDMILRDRFLNNNLLTYDQMHTFGKSGMGHECVYNQGFSLVNYIIKEYGEGALKDITVELSHPMQFSMDKALQKAIGVSGYQLYENWRKKLIDVYEKQTQNINDLKDYKIIENQGYSNFYPSWSPTDQKIAFISDKGKDYFGQSSLYVYSLEDSSTQKIMYGVRTKPGWINDSLLVYSKRSKHNKYGSKFFNLYTYDLIKEEEKQLTEDMRLTSPVYSKEHNKIYAINTFDGASNIVVGNLDFSSFEQLTDFNNGEQIFSLVVKDSLIIYDAVINHERDLFSFNINNDMVEDYKINNWDLRNPDYLNDTFVYSNDKNGIFNLYLESEEKSGYITNVVGGAFMPDLSKDGKIAFSLYDNGKFNLVLINQPQIINNDVGYSNIIDRPDFLNSFYVKNTQNNYYQRPTSNLLDSNSNIESTRYKEKMMGMFFIPRLTIDYNTLKPGFYFFDNEYLDRISLIGGLSINSKKDLDLSLFFDYNKNKSSYYFKFYWMTKNLFKIHPYINANNQVIESLNWHVNYTYELFSADIGNRFKIKNHKFWFYYTYSKYRQYNYPTLVQNYQFNGENIIEQSSSYANDYFRGHKLTFEYKYDARKKDFLYRYTMFPKNGFIVDASISFENNKLFEGFKANDEFGGFIENLKSHNVIRYKVDVSNFWNFGERNNLIIKNNLFLNFLSKDKIDEFLYFHGGGLLGMKGYTYFEPTLQGTKYFLVTNSITKPIFKEQNYKLGWLYLNSFSLSFIHQFGKSSDGSIKVYSGKFIDNKLDEDLRNFLQLSDDWDGLDVLNEIDDDKEKYIFPDIYHKHDSVDLLDADCYQENLEGDITLLCEEYSIRELKERYSAIKQSIGLEFKLLGFSFYSYPTALTYEYHIPINDPWNNNGQQYLRLLFDFADFKR